MWLHEQKDERKEVIEGQQRLTTIIASERGHFDDGAPLHLQVRACKAGCNSDIAVLLSARRVDQAFNTSASPISIHKLISICFLQRLEILETLNSNTYADLKEGHSPFVSSFENYILCLRLVKHETDPAGVFEVRQHWSRELECSADQAGSLQVCSSSHDAILCSSFIAHNLPDTEPTLSPTLLFMLESKGCRMTVNFSEVTPMHIYCHSCFAALYAGHHIAEPFLWRCRGRYIDLLHKLAKDHMSAIQTAPPVSPKSKTDNSFGAFLQCTTVCRTLRLPSAGSATRRYKKTKTWVFQKCKRMPNCSGTPSNW